MLGSEIWKTTGPSVRYIRIYLTDPWSAVETWNIDIRIFHPSELYLRTYYLCREKYNSLICLVFIFIYQPVVFIC